MTASTSPAVDLTEPSARERPDISFSPIASTLLSDAASRSVTAVGDVDGDGRPDLLVGEARSSRSAADYGLAVGLGRVAGPGRAD